MPQITASLEHSEELIPLDLSFDMTLDDVRAYIGAETGEDTENLIIIHNGKTLNEGTKTLTQLEFQPDDIISVRMKNLVQQEQPQQQQTQGMPADMAMQLEMARQQLLGNPSMIQQLSLLYPQITTAVHDPQQFAQLMRPLVEAGLLSGGVGGHPMAGNGYPGGATKEEWDRLQRTKNDPESQKRIKQLEDLEHNFQMAVEETPEMFGSVTMLYVSLEVNGVPVKAFVDSGAQTTIMSPKMLEKCGLTHLIDTRFKGIAQGVGQSTILGRVLVASMSISGQYLPVSLTILDAGVDMLLGLDMLRRHQASIDLKRNVLVIGDVEAPFLPESEIPKSIFDEARLGGQKLGPGLTGATTASGSVGSSSTASAAAAAAASRRLQEASSTPAISSATSTPSFPESVISNLIGLGFSRQEVINALELAGGNAEVAASYLFQ